MGAILLSAGSATASDEVQELRELVDTLRSEVDVLRAEQGTDWMTEQRSEEIRELVQDVLADADTRASLQGGGALAGYDGGFFIKSSDNKFKLKFNGQLQTRWAFNHRKGDASEETNAYGFEVRRFKMKFSGHIFDPSWTYKMTIVNTRNARDGGSASFYSEDAWLQKKFENGIYIKAGQFKAPYLREELVSSSRPAGGRTQHDQQRVHLRLDAGAGDGLEERLAFGSGHVQRWPTGIERPGIVHG